MGLQPGDHVRTESGDVGKVVHISRLTVFVALATRNEADTVQGYLESQLEKIAPPAKGGTIHTPSKLHA
jgi:preprotein translocase subunit YajC